MVWLLTLQEAFDMVLLVLYVVLTFESYGAGLCSSRAWWPLAPNFCFWVTRKS